ncbi:helix-turn-helix domain-containing protein [Roseivirga sp.]|uniref:helix-turn-helix domain-containing protein n=1 Tax=Roseivirga sp. TaxID=1964215 RepID=UPI003B8AC9A3
MSALFLFASLGVINGFILSIYLFIKEEKRIADIYFGGLILSLCLRIGKSVLAHFNDDLDKLILQIGLSACVFIGPLFYLYSKAIRQNSVKHKRSDLLFLGLLGGATIILGIVFPYRTEPEFWNGIMIQSIYLVWAIFLVLGLYENRAVLTKLFRTPKQLLEEERYIIGIAVSVIFITLTYQTALFLRGFTYIWGSIIFSISFYYLAGRKLLGKKTITPKTNSQAPLENGAQLLAQVELWMNTEKPYLDSKLKLDELASQVNLSRHILSRVLNEEYKFGFSDFIRTHRVNEAKRLIEIRDDLSLEGIGFEAGFNSKSAFFDAFKKVTSQTPAAYKKSIQSK